MYFSPFSTVPTPPTHTNFYTETLMERYHPQTPLSLKRKFVPNYDPYRSGCPESSFYDPFALPVGQYNKVPMPILTTSSRPPKDWKTYSAITGTKSYDRDALDMTSSHKFEIHWRGAPRPSLSMRLILQNAPRVIVIISAFLESNVFLCVSRRVAVCKRDLSRWWLPVHCVPRVESPVVKVEKADDYIQTRTTFPEHIWVLVQVDVKTRACVKLEQIPGTDVSVYVVTAVAHSDRKETVVSVGSVIRLSIQSSTSGRRHVYVAPVHPEPAGRPCVFFSVIEVGYGSRGSVRPSAGRR